MQNYIFIGDNLPIMQNTKFKNIVDKVDTIYIDPPYNTKNKFSFKDSKERNNWLNFMQIRLEEAKKYLKDSGVVFISIDDNECAYLRVLCNEIFGEQNCLGCFITRQAQRSNAKYINITHEYVLCYAKDKKNVNNFKVRRIDNPEERKAILMISDKVKQAFINSGREEAQHTLNNLIKLYIEDTGTSWIKNYCSIDDNGEIYFGKDLSTPSKPNSVSIPEINLELSPLPTRGWSSPEKFKELYYQNKLVYKDGRPYEKQLLIDAEDNVSSVLNFYSRQGSNDLNKLGLRDLFDTPKPVDLIKYLIKISTPKDGIVMDFFAGSGTTAQAVYELNEEENASRNYVLIQSNEKVDSESKSFDACINYGIDPVFSELLLLRINTFLKSNNLSIDYQVIFSLDK